MRSTGGQSGEPRQGWREAPGRSPDLDGQTASATIPATLAGGPSAWCLILAT